MDIRDGEVEIERNTIERKIDRVTGRGVFERESVWDRGEREIPLNI